MILSIKYIEIFAFINIALRRCTILNIAYLFLFSLHFVKSGAFLMPHHCLKNTFFVKDFFSKCSHIWSHLLKKSLMENCLFYVEVCTYNYVAV